MNLVSVIIPYYKKINYIEKTLKSVFNQTYQNIEIIIIYDDENKHELKKIKEKTKHKKKIKIIINKKNIGAGKSRNKGIKIAKGKFLAFIDSDDVWKKSKIKEQIKFMQKNNYLITHTSYNIVDKYNKIITTRKAVQKLTYKNLLNSCDIGLSTVMINRKKVKKIFFGSTRTKEDYSLWLTLSKQTAFYGLNKNLTNWKKLNNSLSSNSTQKIIDAFMVYYNKEKLSFIVSMYRTFLLSVNFLNKSFFKINFK
jgi:teichuronic acid biosynthesis glycosyltransferase TuaG